MSFTKFLMILVLIVSCLIGLDYTENQARKGANDQCLIEYGMPELKRRVMLAQSVYIVQKIHLRILAVKTLCQQYADNKVIL